MFIGSCYSLMKYTGLVYYKKIVRLPTSKRVRACSTTSWGSQVGLVQFRALYTDSIVVRALQHSVTGGLKHYKELTIVFTVLFQAYKILSSLIVDFCIIYIQLCSFALL